MSAGTNDILVIRERFEERQRLYGRDMSKHPNGAYVDARTEQGWLDWQECWKASRANLELVMPPAPPTTKGRKHYTQAESAYHQGQLSVRAVIEAAGLKVKP